MITNKTSSSNLGYYLIYVYSCQIENRTDMATSTNKRHLKEKRSSKIVEYHWHPKTERINVKLLSGLYAERNTHITKTITDIKHQIYSFVFSSLILINLNYRIIFVKKTKNEKRKECESVMVLKFVRIFLLCIEKLCDAWRPVAS